MPEHIRNLRPSSEPRWLRTLLIACMAMAAIATGLSQEEADPPEVAVGERLFLETRLAQAFKQYFPDQDVLNAGALDESRCSVSALLPKTVARFKTPGLRDLSHGGPYFHNGQFDTLKDVVTFYATIASSARAGTIRNAAANLAGIAIDATDLDPLVAFLKSLNEDYN